VNFVYFEAHEGLFSHYVDLAAVNTVRVDCVSVVNIIDGNHIRSVIARTTDAADLVPMEHFDNFIGRQRAYHCNPDFYCLESDIDEILFQHISHR
jgi:hypothetical protein